MKTFDEAIAFIKDAKHAEVDEIFQRYSEIRKEARDHDSVRSLLVTLLSRVAAGTMQPVESLWCAFMTGLIAGIEMEKTNETLRLHNLK